MIDIKRFGRFSTLALVVLVLTAGCRKDLSQVAAGSVQDPSSDPAAANLAPDSGNSSTPATYSAANASPAPAAYSGQQQSAPPPDNGGYYDSNAGQPQDQGSDDPGYGEQPVQYATQPPPPIPDYDQPQAPGDDYLWTPGYWGYADMGYYWVPGVWVEAPYEGALWTPGYWGYRNHRYGFYRGYWGPHIGYYGGIDYGFGYIGFGYQGGYWGGGHFNYNRSVNNVNITVVHNVYNRSVGDGRRGGDRISFTGGVGGLQVRARPAEMAAQREMHAQPMSAQMQNERAASGNRAQFATQNHGRPASFAVSQPLTADRNVRAPASVQMRNDAEAQQRDKGRNQPGSVQQQRPGQPGQAQPDQTPPFQNRPGRDQTNQPQPNRDQPNPFQQNRNQPQPNRDQPGNTPQPQQAPRQIAPQNQHQIAPERQVAPQPQRPEYQQRQQAPQQQPQHQAAPQQQERPQAPQPQQRQAAPQQQERPQAPQQQQRQQAPQQQQRQQAPQQQQQHQQAPQQQHQAPPQREEEKHPK